MEKELEQKTAAYLTHELRAPLQALQFALDVLKANLASGDSEKNRKTIDAALWTSRRLGQLVDDVLEVSRLQSGRVSAEIAPCEPGRLAADTVSFLQPWAERKRVRLSLRVKQGCPEIAADAKRTVQVLTNLLSNALKFTPAGGDIELSVRRGEREDAGFVVFSVRDSGPGFSPADAERIFRYFVQVGTAEQRSQGSGLGLPLARSLVEIQGGRMWAEGRPGAGAAFHFTLPVAAATARASEAAERPAEALFVE